jgi:signal transduction histidine kinase
MRGSIRDRILIPLLLVQALAVAVTAVVAAALAAGRVEREVGGRLDGVVEALGRSNFPLTSGILEKMRGLSGAHFVACDPDGRVIASTLPGRIDLPSTLRSLPSRPRLEPLGRSPATSIDGAGYFAAAIHSSSGPERPSLLVLYPEAAWTRARWEAAVPPLAIGLASLVPMALVTGWVAHRLSARLRSVQGQVAAIAAGDFATLEADGVHDEVSDLVDSVNRMASQLEELREAIRRSERAGVLAQLAAGLTHQLRNAATGARMAVQLHARRCEQAGSDGSLDVALRQLSLCEGQLKGLLALGRREPANISECDASHLVAEVASLVEPASRHGRVDLRQRSDDGLALVGDPGAIRAALLNLALNAIEAAGPGPPDALRTSLFEPFVTSKPEGVGLGLALARRVAVDHGGALDWSREGGITRFRLTLPRSRTPAEVGA